MDLSDYSKSARRKVLVYGPPKVGKTALVGKLAEHFKLHWLDMESGIKTLMNPAILDPKYRSNIQLANVPDHAGYPIALQTLTKVLKGEASKICFTHGKVSCPICAKDADAKHTTITLKEFTENDILVVDTLGQVAASAMNTITLKERQNLLLRPLAIMLGCKGKLLPDHRHMLAWRPDHRQPDLLLVEH